MRRERLVALTVLIGLGGILPVLPVSAQELLNYYTDSLECVWAKGIPPNDVPADRFRFKCGPAAGQYTYPVREKPASANDFPIHELAPSQGVTHCTCYAANKYGESAQGAPNFPFDAGAAPTAPSFVKKKVRAP